MKPLELPTESKDALLDGACMFLVPINTGTIFLQRWDDGTKVGREMLHSFVKDCSPYQIGDEVYFDDFKATIKDVKVVRVQDLDALERYKLTKIRFQLDSEGKLNLIDWYSKQYGNYDDNPYLFLYEVEE